MRKISDSLLIRRLESQDDRSKFYSGDPDIDRFFIKYAGQNQFKHYIGTTYVAVINNKILGYATVSVGEITTEHVTRTTYQRFPKYPLPVLRIARLGVEKEFQNQGIGKALLKRMLKLALDLRESVGCVGVLIDAKLESVKFYNRLGFISLEGVSGLLDERPQPIPMFLALKKLDKII